MNQFVGLVTMRRMTAIGKLNDFGICNPPRNTMNLLKRTIFIVKSLHRKHRTTDILDFRFNRPFPKRRMQPDIVPAPER